MRLALAFLAGSLAFAPQLAAAQNNPDLNAGGLAPPPAIEGEGPPPAASTTEQDLERAEREDAGRGLTFIWVNGEVGYEVLGLQTFHSNDLVDSEVVESTQNGLVFGAGLGVRLIVFTIGGRFRLANFDQWQLWTLNAEAGFRIPLGALEPYFTFGGGYASLGSFDTGSFGGALGESDGPDVSGFNLRGGVGLDYFVGSTLSVGANLSGDLLFLSRPRVSGFTAGTDDDGTAIYASDGSSIGGGATLMAVVGLHF